MNNRGFTLIEIVIAVAIIGILASMSIPIFKFSAAKAKRNEAYITLKYIWEMEQAYYSRHGTYAPPTGFWLLPGGTAGNFVDIKSQLPASHGYDYSVLSVDGLLLLSGMAHGRFDIDGDDYPDWVMMDRDGKLFLIRDDITNTEYPTGIAGGLTPQDRTYTEDFDDISDWEFAAGKKEHFRVENGELNMGPGEVRAFWGDNNWRDVSIELSFSLHSGKGFGIMFRTSGGTSDNGYILQYNPGRRKGSLLLRKRLDGREQQPFAVANIPGKLCTRNTDHNIHLDIRGNHFIAHIDGQPVLEAEDSTFASGRIGLRTLRRTRVSFHKLSVTPKQGER